MKWHCVINVRCTQGCTTTECEKQRFVCQRMGRWVVNPWLDICHVHSYQIDQKRNSLRPEVKASKRLFPTPVISSLRVPETSQDVAIHYKSSKGYLCSAVSNWMVLPFNQPKMYHFWKDFQRVNNNSRTTSATMLTIILETIYNLVMLFYYIGEAFVMKFIPTKFRTKDISGQVALVTGAGGGIGRLIALGLSNLGCVVVCWDIAKQGKTLGNVYSR